MQKLMTCLRVRLGRFAAARDGATAVEFAIVAVPLFLFLFVLFDVGFIFSISTSLDNAVAQSSRQIRTGALQSQPTPATLADFANSICQNMTIPGADCTNLLGVDVRKFSCFQSATLPPTPITNGAFDPSKLMFDMGGPGDIIVIRAFYQWPLMAPGLEGALQPLSNKALITSATTFRNEPYGQAAPAAPTC